MRPFAAASLFVVVIAVSACAAGATPSPAGATASPTTQPSTTTAVSTSPSAAASKAATAAAGQAKPAVDLTLTGVLTVTAKGSAGQCMLGKDASGNVTKFGFGATQADYPGLGDGLFITEGNNGFVTVKWIPSSSQGFLNVADIQGAVSADHRSVTLNADIGSGAAREHVAGTVRCP